MTAEQPTEFIDQLRPVTDFMRQQYWHVYDPAERDRMLAAIATVNRGVPAPGSGPDD